MAWEWIVGGAAATAGLVAYGAYRIRDTGFGSHSVPMMVAFEHTTGPVLELGSGYFSTPMLHHVCKRANRPLLTLESDAKWLETFKHFSSDHHRLVHFAHAKDRSYDINQLVDFDRIGLCFVDHSPCQRRIDDIKALRSKVDVFVVHDTEKAFYADWLYHYWPDLNDFKYTYTFKARPATTIVSDTIDVANWLW